MEQWKEFEQQLRRRGIPFTAQEPLSRHTSFRIGGPAAVFCEPYTPEQLRQTLSLCRAAGLRTYILGRGTNILFADEGFDGVVVHVGEKMSGMEQNGTFLTAQAGAQLAHVCARAGTEGLEGLEFAFGIPGCVGGAVYMNAGAYGGEIKDVLASVTFLDETGNERTLQKEELAMGYRTSVFEQHPEWCILSAIFALERGDSAVIQARMKDYLRRRAEKQPLNMPSAGSTFKRPEGAYAGALIEQCGLRGCSIGGAQVSEKHCGFLVNRGGATCEDVLSLADVVCKIVTEQTGYRLEKEIRVVK